MSGWQAGRQTNRHRHGRREMSGAWLGSNSDLPDVTHDVLCYNLSLQLAHVQKVGPQWSDSECSISSASAHHQLNEMQSLICLSKCQPWNFLILQAGCSSAQRSSASKLLTHLCTIIAICYQWACGRRIVLVAQRQHIPSGRSEFDSQLGHQTFWFTIAIISITSEQHPCFVVDGQINRKTGRKVYRHTDRDRERTQKTSKQQSRRQTRTEMQKASRQATDEDTDIETGRQTKVGCSRHGLTAI